MSTTRTNRRLALVLAGMLGIGAALVGPITPAGADIDDLCGDPINQCQDPLDGPDDLANPTADPEPDDELPPADVDGTVVANPTFTG